MSKKVFIGGSRKVSRLNETLRNLIDNEIIEKKCHAFIGDANGSDKAIQHYLSINDHKAVTIYCSGDNCRNNLGHWQMKNVPVSRKTKDRVFYAIKDEAMAEDCDSAIMLWDGISTGTLNNCLNVLGLNKPVTLFESPKKTFHNLESMDDFKDKLNGVHPDIWAEWDKKINLTERLNGEMPDKQFILGI